MNSAAVRTQRMVDDYKRAHAKLLADNPDFREWLDKEYVPIVGGWQY